MTAALKNLTQKGCPPPGRKSHPFVSYLQKARKHLCRKSTRPWKTKWKFWRWLKEKVEKFLFTFGKIRESEMCVSDCIQKISVSGQAFCSWCHETIRYRPVNQHFVWLFFCFKFTSYYFDICQFRCGNEDSRGNENRKSWKRIFSVGKKSISILFSLWKVDRSVNPYPPRHSYVSSTNRDPGTRVGGPSTGIRVHKYVVIDRRARIPVTYLLHVNYVIRNYDLYTSFRRK